MPHKDPRVARAYHRKYRQEHKREYNAWRRDWKKKRHDLALASQRRYQKKHRRALKQKRRDPKVKQAIQRWRARHPKRVRELNRIAVLRSHGLTPERFDELLAAQGGGCAICGTTSPGGWGWHVDHDHSCCSGRYGCGECVRGVLCSRCNPGIGNFKDDPALLRRAAEYLERRSKP